MSQKSFQDRCRDFFHQADTDNTGCLSKFELCKVCRNAGCGKPVDEMADWFDDLDTNDDDKVSEDEFMNALGKIPAGEVKESDLRSCFKRFDTDNSGCISTQELKAACAAAGLEGQADFGGFDLNNDGKVNCEEFLKAWRSRQND